LYNRIREDEPKHHKEIEMNKKPHEVDAHDAAAIKTAVYFVASIFLGRGQFDKHNCETLSEARQVCKLMDAHYDNGRKAMVYAALPNGRQVFVPDNHQA
jgi:hypothetical protein